MNRRFLRGPLLVLFLTTGLSNAFPASMHLGQGTMSGEVTASSAFLQTRITADDQLDATGDMLGTAGLVTFEWGTQSDFAKASLTSTCLLYTSPSPRDRG